MHWSDASLGEGEPTGRLADAQYDIGIGKADITGPCAGLRFFGYGHLTQVGEGLEQRLFARAFIIRHAGSGSVVFVNCDLGMISELIRLRVLHDVQERLGNLYAPDDICLAATHTHSAPGGYSAYMLYNVSITGHSPQLIDTITNGIVRAIDDAHRSLQPGYVTMAAGPLQNASMNRSIEPHRNNPEVAQGAFPHPFNDRMTQLCFWNQQHQLRGLLNWFAVHGTSYDVHNHLVSGDNKGYASWFVEQSLGPDVVAAFTQSNSGDISPNRRETPDNRLEGEGSTPRESTRIIGERQARKAIDLAQSPQRLLYGELHSRLLHVDFANSEAPPLFSSTGRSERIGPAILGQNFIPGTKDGRGPAWFAYGSPERELLVRFVTRVTTPINAEERRRHAPKYPFLKLSRSRRSWAPHVLPLQMFTIGQCAIVAIPFETSTVAGHRICRLVEPILQRMGVDETVLTCLSNAYSGYLTTPEEYDLQYYEGASTLFGREQLNAVRYHLDRLATSMVEGRPAPPGAPAPTLKAMKIFGPNLDKTWVDATPGMAWFGDVVDDCQRQYRPGDTAAVTFWSAHPAHSQHGTSYFNVEKQVGEHWECIADDHDWSTRFHWRTYFSIFARCTCEWEIPPDCASGAYRLAHHGTWQTKSGELRSYVGVSRAFEVNRIAPRLAEAIDPNALPIFAGVTAAERQAAQPYFDTIAVAPGETIIEQGERDRAVMYVLAGKLGIWVNDVELDHSGPGELLGELALFDQHPRSASARAIDAAKLLKLPLEGYEALRRDGNEVAYQIERCTLEAIASRLRRLDFIIHQLAEGVPSPYVKPSASMLATIRRWFTGPQTPGASAPLTVDIDLLAVFKQTRLFTGASDDDLRIIANWFTQAPAAQGDFLCTQGEPGDSLYFIGAGAVDVVVSVYDEAEERIKTLARLQAGDMFGLTSLVDGRSRGASCVASEPARLFVLSRRQWQICLRQSDRAASALRQAMIRAFSAQLRDSQRHILSLDDSSKVTLENLIQGSARLEVSQELLPY